MYLPRPWYPCPDAFVGFVNKTFSAIYHFPPDAEEESAYNEYDDVRFTEDGEAKLYGTEDQRSGDT